MTPEQRIRNLLAAAEKAARKGTEPKDPEAAARKLARVAWVHQRMAALRAAHRKVDEAWRRIFEALPDGLSDEEVEAISIPDPPEQAELDAIHAEIRAVVKRDLWPRGLYWSL